MLTLHRTRSLLIVASAVTCWLMLVALAGCTTSEMAAKAPEAIQEEPEQLFTRSNWEMLATDPNAYKGARVDVSGKVFVPPERGDEAVVWQMYIDPEASQFNCIVRYDAPDFSVSMDDYVHVTGTVEKELRGQNALGGEVSAPIVRADSVEQTDVLATMAEPDHSLQVGDAKVQHEVTLTVERIDVAPRETRVHIRIVNESSSKFHFYTFNAKLVQGNAQFDPEFRMDYPEPQTDLLPGVSTTGVIAFKRIDPSQGFRVLLEGTSEDWKTEFNPFEFSIPAIEQNNTNPGKRPSGGTTS